jgi:hypothetical protein
MRRTITDKIELLKKINREKKILRALLFSLFALTAAFLSAFANSLFVEESSAFAGSCLIIIAGFLLSLAAYIIIRAKSGEKLTDTAKGLDSFFGAKNRLESAAEMQSISNPLKEKQLSDTENFYRRKEIGSPFPAIFFLLAVNFIFIALNSYILFTQYEISASAGAREKLTAKKKEMQKEIPPSPDFAELSITYPESDIRAKPMDEISWTADGVSSKPLTELYLSVFLNGSLKTNIKIDKESAKAQNGARNFQAADAKPDAAAKHGGNKNQTSHKIAIEGEICLDSLNVVPFDVVSYHLVGTADLNGRRATVSSAPQFVEIRPFREDALILNLAGMPSEMRDKIEELLSILNQSLRSQILLNKAVFVLANSADKVERKIISQEVEMLAKDQLSLVNDLKEALQLPPELISAEMMNHLRLAQYSMFKAGKTLEKIK